METYIEEVGDPFTGKRKRELKEFLKKQNLTYDDEITHSVILRNEKEIIATGSCQKNIIKCVAVSELYQGNNLLASVITSLVEYFYGIGIFHFFGFTKPENKSIFCSMGFYPVAQTENVLLMENTKDGLKKFLTVLKKETQDQQTVKVSNVNGQTTGAVVLNGNPFTKGHEYLIRKAAEKSKWVHVFVLSEEQEFLTTQERYELVKEGVKNIPNVILHQTSDYMISPAVFPTYFLKDKEKAYEMNCELDIRIFGKYIAPALGIAKRFVGSEPYCEVTEKYNRYLKERLPEYQIQLYEVPRMCRQDQAVSASLVRKYYGKNQMGAMHEMLPESTYVYLMRKKHESDTNSFIRRGFD